MGCLQDAKQDRAHRDDQAEHRGQVEPVASRHVPLLQRGRDPRGHPAEQAEQADHLEPGDQAPEDAGDREGGLAVHEQPFDRPEQPGRNTRRGRLRPEQGEGEEHRHGLRKLLRRSRELWRGSARRHRSKKRRKSDPYNRDFQSKISHLKSRIRNLKLARARPRGARYSPRRREERFCQGLACVAASASGAVAADLGLARPPGAGRGAARSRGRSGGTALRASSSGGPPPPARRRDGRSPRESPGAPTSGRSRVLIWVTSCTVSRSATRPISLSSPRWRIAIRSQISCMSASRCPDSTIVLPWLAELADQLLDLGRADRVEARSRLVEQDQLGVVDQGLSQPDPALHPLGVLAELAVLGARQAHQVDQPIDPLGPLGCARS